MQPWMAPTPASSLSPQGAAQLWAGSRFPDHSPTSTLTFKLHPYPGPAPLELSASEGATVTAACSETVKFLLPDLFHGVIKTFHGQLCQERNYKGKRCFNLHHRLSGACCTRGLPSPHPATSLGILDGPVESSLSFLCWLGFWSPV